MDPSPDNQEYGDIFDDIRTVFEPGEEEKDIELGNFNTDESENKMLPKKSLGSRKPSARRASTGSWATESITKTMGNMSIKAEQPHVFGFAQTLLFVKKSFTKVSYNTLSNTSTIHDFAEVAFMSMTMDLDHFCISLSSDGMNCVIYIAVPEMFGEVKRLEK